MRVAAAVAGVSDCWCEWSSRAMLTRQTTVRPSWRRCRRPALQRYEKVNANSYDNNYRYTPLEGMPSSTESIFFIS